MTMHHDPAAPVTLPARGGDDRDVEFLGLTKREHFAALALQGVIAGFLAADVPTGYAEAATEAVGYADALIAALNA
jgi:hypothetical protein